MSKTTATLEDRQVIARENKAIKARLLQMIERLNVMEIECMLAESELNVKAMKGMKKARSGLRTTFDGLVEFAEHHLGKGELGDTQLLNDSLSTITDLDIEPEQIARVNEAPEQPVVSPVTQASDPETSDRYVIGPLPPITRVALSCLNRVEEVRCAIHSAADAAGNDAVDKFALERIEEGFCEVTSGFFDLFRNTGLKDQNAPYPNTTEDQKPDAA